MVCFVDGYDAIRWAVITTMVGQRRQCPFHRCRFQEERQRYRSGLYHYNTSKVSS